jgi:hypothetical protein
LATHRRRACILCFVGKHSIRTSICCSDGSHCTPFMVELDCPTCSTLTTEHSRILSLSHDVFRAIYCAASMSCCWNQKCSNEILCKTNLKVTGLVLITGRKLQIAPSIVYSYKGVALVIGSNVISDGKNNFQTIAYLMDLQTNRPIKQFYFLNIVESVSGNGPTAYLTSINPKRKGNHTSDLINIPQGCVAFKFANDRAYFAFSDSP